MALRKGSDLTAVEVYFRLVSATITKDAVVVGGITLDAGGNRVRDGEMDIKPFLSAAGLTALGNLYAAAKTAVEEQLGLAPEP